MFVILHSKTFDAMTLGNVVILGNAVMLGDVVKCGNVWIDLRDDDFRDIIYTYIICMVRQSPLFTKAPIGFTWELV